MRRLLMFLTACVLPSASFAAEEADIGQVRRIDFKREVWLKVTPPCTLQGEGSKLTVYPRGISFADFTKAVSWTRGAPGYLAGTDPASTRFDFDLVDAVTFNAEMVIKVIRTTMISTDEGTILVAKGSRMPRILKRPAELSR